MNKRDRVSRLDAMAIVSGAIYFYLTNVIAPCKQYY
jgi:hypothetical protein